MSDAMSKQWSVGLRQTTREILNELPILPNGIVHMKHINGGSGTMDMVKILGGVYEIIVRSDATALSFSDIEAVIDAGWVID